MVMAPGGNLGGDVGSLKPANIGPDPDVSSGGLVLAPPNASLSFSSADPKVGVSAYDPNTLFLRGNSTNGLTIGQGTLRLATNRLAWGADHNNESAVLYGGSGAPAMAATDGSYYFRSDTPGTANQRIYVRSGGAWVGIV